MKTFNMRRCFSIFFKSSTVIAGFALILSTSTASLAHDFTLGQIHADHPVAPASLPGQTSAVVYLILENKGTAADKLVALQSPAAQSVVVHQMTMNGSVMAMREVESLSLAPLATVALKAGNSYHIMMTGLKQPLKVNDVVPLTLTFEQAGKMEVMVHVERNAVQKAGDKTTHAHQH